MITELKTTLGEWIACKVPDGTHIAGITSNTLYYWINYGSYDVGDYPKSVSLPPGEWEIVGKAFDLSEEQWMGIAPGYYIERVGPIYPDYVNGSKRSKKNGIDSEVLGFDNALQSGHSLLAANGIYKENPLPNPKIKQPMCRDCADEDGTCPNYSGRYCDPDLRAKQYKEVQQKVYNPLILKKK